MEFRRWRPDSFLEHPLCLAQEIPLIGVGIVPGRVAELFEQMSLFGIEFHRRLDNHAHKLVAHTPAMDIAKTFTSKPKDLVALCTRRDSDFSPAVKGRHIYLRAQGRLRKRDRDFADYVVTMSLEYGMGSDMNDYVEVAPRTSVPAGFTFTRKFEPGARIDTGGYRHHDLAFDFNQPVTAAPPARMFDHSAFTPASWTRSGYTEESL